MAFWRRSKRRDEVERVAVENKYGLGDGSPLLIDRVPDLARLLSDPDPEPPQAAGAVADGWRDADAVRFGIVMAYLLHPDPQVRVAAIRAGVAREFGRSIGFQGELVDLLDDAEQPVHAAAARALWSLQGESRCERAVMELRDEIRGHSLLFGRSVTESLRLTPERAVAALDRLVRYAPDDGARAGIRALVEERVVIPERVTETDTSGVAYVETTFRAIGSGGGGRRRATYEVYRAPNRAQAIAFLKNRTVARELHYVEVETPEGTFGRDVKGIYDL